MIEEEEVLQVLEDERSAVSLFSLREESSDPRG